MKTPLPVALLVAAALFAPGLLRADPPEATAAQTASRQAATQAATVSGVTIPAATVATYRAAEPATLQAGAGEEQLQTLARLLRDYRVAFGANPVGNNREIARLLRGGNPRGTRFGDDRSVPVSERGELLDRWGHPLYFHPISATVMEVRSAGPDGKMWTTDDLVAR